MIKKNGMQVMSKQLNANLTKSLAELQIAKKGGMSPISLLWRNCECSGCCSNTCDGDCYGGCDGSTKG